MADVGRWSPRTARGSHFPAAIPASRSRKLYLIPSGGGEPEQLTPGVPHSGDGTWSPDGESIVYLGINSKGTHSLQIVGLKTRQVTVVPKSEGLISPRWSPDGKYLLAMPEDFSRLTLFDFARQSWQELTPEQKLPVHDYTRPPGCRTASASSSILSAWLQFSRIPHHALPIPKAGAYRGYGPERGDWFMGPVDGGRGVAPNGSIHLGTRDAGRARGFMRWT